MTPLDPAARPQGLRRETLLDGAVLKLILDAPPGNVLDRALVAQLSSVFAEPPPRATRLILIEGAGKHFSFGASVAEHAREHVGKMLPEFHGLFHLMAGLGVPTAALVRGQCLGGGLELAAACDYIFVEEGAALAQPEIKLAVFPPMASVALPWRIGAGRALELLTTGRALTAAEALDWGLATAKFEAGKGLEGALEWATKNLLPLSGVALHFAVLAARTEYRRRLATDLPALEKIYLDELMKTHDANEGIASFLEKRKPGWRHE